MMGPDFLAGALAHPRLGVVVIGRNEGERLVDCLESVRALDVPLVYVDSGSSDGSVARARELCDRVNELDPARPFSAARARNVGFERLLSELPSIEFVQFLDGDCTVLPQWLAAAEAAMAGELRRAVVVGELRERRPHASVYNRMCALEWRSPAGDLQNFGALGGIMFVRAPVFRTLGGFNEMMIAGEDSEFGVRVCIAGFTITKLDLPMATHDANILHFTQWWKRAVRGGHAIGQRAQLQGATAVRDCVRERRSTWLWGIALPVLALGLAVPTHGQSLALAAAYPLLGWRVYRYRRSCDDEPSDARLYAGFTMMGKLANGLGLLQFYLNRRKRRYRLIEYK